MGRARAQTFVDDALKTDDTEETTGHGGSCDGGQNDDAEHATGVSTRGALQKARFRGGGHGRALGGRSKGN